MSGRRNLLGAALMYRVKFTFPPTSSLAVLLKRIGNPPPERDRAHPSPRKATEQDVITIEAREGRLYELVDGVLVEKTVGLRESFLAVDLGRFVGNFVDERDLGICTGADGAVRLMPRLVRI